MITKEHTTPEMQEIIESFNFFDDWEARYSYLIDLGKELESLDEADKIDANKVHGCTSQVWLVHTTHKEVLRFKADSDAFIVRGLIALLLKIYSNKTREEIVNIDITHLFNEIGFNSFLSPARSNGFFSMVQRIKETASA